MSQELERHFEGPEVLDELLALADSPLDTQAVAEAMLVGQAERASASQVIPTFFEGEPRFPSAEVARRLYQNLFGLWDLLGAGKKVDLTVKPPRPPRPPRVEAPPPFAPGEPDDAFVEAAWRHLSDLRPHERARLEDTLENRQSFLLQWLDGSGLSDEAFAVARHLLYELFAMLHLGWPAGLLTVQRAKLGGPSDEPAPAALVRYAEEAVFESQQDEQTPLPSADAKRVELLVGQALAALWSARARSGLR